VKRSPAATTTTTTQSGSSTAAGSVQRSNAATPAVSSVPSVPSPAVRKPFAVDESLSLQRHRHCKLVGQTTALDASLISLGTFSEKNETESRMGTLRQVTGSEYFSTHADADVPIPDDEARALAEIEATVGQHGPALIEIYFRNVHPSFPILQKVAFLDRHRHGDKQFNPPLLAAMYLLALGWWEQDPALCQYPKPDMARLEYIAITSLTTAMQRPKMSAVQAGLLLLQRAKSSTWTLTVQLVALGQDIGLHLDCTNWSIPLWERRLRKRLAWALYMQDKWSAVMHGRPSHINPADWAVPDPTLDDFDETIPPNLPTPSDEDVDATQMARGRTIFMQMISLTRIMAEVCSTFYSQTAQAEFKRAERYATQLVLNRAKPVQIKLKDWFAKLPAECKMDHSSATSAPSSPPASSNGAGGRGLQPQGYLHLAYFATEISIHRRIVLSLSPSPETAPAPSLDPYMLYIIRSAAKTRLISALDFVNRLRPEHLDAFWYFASASNFALIGTFGALLQATAPGKEEAEFYEARLREYRWCLGVSARRAEWVREAGEVVEGNEEMLRLGLSEKPAVGNGQMMQVPVRQASSAGGQGGMGQVRFQSEVQQHHFDVGDEGFEMDDEEEQEDGEGADGMEVDEWDDRQEQELEDDVYE
jgi:hypothetical protein